MSQIISAASIDTLANFAFTELRREIDPEMPSDKCLSDGSCCALLDLLRADARIDVEHAETRALLSGLCNGVEYGISIAASIATHALDAAALKAAVKVDVERMIEGYGRP